MKKKAKTTVHAHLVINNASKMTRKGRRLLAAWIGRRAVDVRISGDLYSKRFTATYQS